jgi:tellurite resistance protein
MAEFELSAEERKSALMNAALIMLADGKATDEELEVLYGIARRVGIAQEETEQILKDSSEAKFVVPKDRKEKISQLVDMIVMMSVDGNVDSYEKNLCLTFATGLGFGTVRVAKFIDGITERAEKREIITRRELALALEEMLLEE